MLKPTLLVGLVLLQCALSAPVRQTPDGIQNLDKKRSAHVRRNFLDLDLKDIEGLKNIGILEHTFTDCFDTADFWKKMQKLKEEQELILNQNNHFLVGPDFEPRIGGFRKEKYDRKIYYPPSERFPFTPRRSEGGYPKIEKKKKSKYVRKSFFDSIDKEFVVNANGNPSEDSS